MLDTNILIGLIRSNKETSRFLLHEKVTEPYISTITYVEFIGGAKQRRKVEALKLVRTCILLDCSAMISDKAMIWARKYEFTKSQTMDYLIAATAYVNKLPLVTYNQKDFSIFEGLTLISP